MESQGVLGVSRGSQDVRQDVRGSKRLELLRQYVVNISIVRGSQVVKGQRLGGRGDQGVHLTLKGS